ncbi:hypothetical protein [Burkholderia ubonensis]|uniref:hypothetical protein n=1 Tax=Burkholderia ubonensis TaxID=101571 RepID=UPI000AD3C697|nr:hypothetical protein [Burkholderia ubonensis]
MKHYSILKLAPVAFALMGVFSAAHAGSNTSLPITLSLAVSSANCTVANNNTSISLPSGAPSTTVANWITSNATVAGQKGAGWYTSANLNQTATVSCTAANTPILSVVVQPASGATTATGNTAEQNLVDTATTPNKAGGTTPMLMGYEQVSVGGTAAAYSYDSGTGPQSYSTAFQTGALSGTTSTATVVWRPAFSANGSTTSTLGTPSGGNYTGNAVINITY